MSKTLTERTRVAERAKARKILLAYLRAALAASFLILPSPALAESELDDRNHDLRRYSVQIYSKAFAERFELSPENAGNDLPKELHAMELLAERRERSQFLQCSLKIYFDSGLPVYLPEGPPAGVLEMKREGAHFFSSLKRDDRGRAVSWSDADRKALFVGESPYNRAARLVTREYKLHSVGAGQGMRILEYHKEILPGVGYMKFGPACAWLAGTDRYPSGWNLWIKRQGAADYSRILHENPDDFFQWPVPETLLASFRATAARIASTTSSNCEAVPQATTLRLDRRL